MTKKSFSNFFQKNGKTIFLTLLCVFLTALSYHVATHAFTRYAETSTGDVIPETHSGLENLGGGWWEANRLIYHGIPARTVFLLPPASPIDPEIVNAAVWHEFDRIGAIFNPFHPDSEISRLNSSPHAKPISVSDDIYSVVSLSQRLWTDSQGLFDPTMWQIKQLWQAAEKNQQIPSAADIADALQWTGLENVQMEKTTGYSLSFKNHPVKFDFGGIVKGYAVDQTRDILLNSGVTAGLVQLGGEISAFGDNKGKPWRIGIQHPRQMDRIWGVISSFGSLRVSTSGNYRQPLQINGKSFYHIFSPNTGRPVSEKVLGVTTADFDEKTSNARLDGIATAITVMGAAEGLALAERLGFDVLILHEKKNGSIGEIMTPGLIPHYLRNDR